MTDKPNDGCNPETLSEHLAFREKMAQASRDCIRRNEEDMKRERDSELASLRAEVERLTDHRKRLCKIIRDTYAELYNAPEINMSNFNDDNVAALNDAMIGAFQNLDAAMCSFSSETGEII